jgi:hypothetical protein
MTNNTQLPAEVVLHIEEEANNYVEQTRGRQGRVETYIAGATEYATKLHAARELLEKAINSRSLHNVKNYDLLNEIKTFLDGAK